MENGRYVLWVQQSGEDQGEETWQGYDGTSDLRYLNHSSSANCEMDGQSLYAAVDIEKGEELTIDYGEDFDREEAAKAET